MRHRSWLALGVLIPFFVFSVFVAEHHGALGFISLAWRGGWETQVFVDLVIALSVASTVVYRDARKRGLNPWPWMIAMPALGSIAMLGYFVYREIPGGNQSLAPMR